MKPIQKLDERCRYVLLAGYFPFDDAGDDEYRLCKKITGPGPTDAQILDEVVKLVKARCSHAIPSRERDRIRLV